MAASYRKNFDYAAAIADTQDEATRSQLLAERQAKIDAEGLSGKVAANNAVSTWTAGYRPYSVDDSASSGALSVSGLYDTAAKSRLQRFESARQRIAENRQADLSAIEASYRAGITQAERNARSSVQGNEEKLAALGLNMGSRYAAATSGAAETSRIALQNAYQSDLSSLGTARLNARSALERQSADALASLEGNYYDAESDAALSAAKDLLAQKNADRDYSLSVAGLTGYLNGSPTLAYRSFTSGRDAAAYEQALARWKACGYVLADDAATLGVPAGTSTADAAYQSGALSLQRWKSGYSG